jgi:nucleoside-diphosphate-sugar epimerase
LDRNRSSRHDSSTQSIETLYFDQPNQLVATVRSARPDYVIHLHAVVTTERSTAAVRRTLEVNLLPSLDLMVACGEMKVKRLSSWAPAKSLVP